MTGARARVLSVLIAALIAAAIVGMAVAGRSGTGLEPRPSAQRPVLLLLTSLPIQFGEDFSLERKPSPVLAALQSRFRVVSISVTDPGGLSRGRILLMAHPLAQPAEDLVALDSWVRQGGRLLLLADPMLEWPSARPLGDPLRPPMMFMDTGLLAHWGLRLDAPDERGARTGRIGGREVLTQSPGRLSGRCDVGPNGLVARCRIGKGRATVIADADFIDPDRSSRSKRNLDALLAELAELERA